MSPSQSAKPTLKVLGSLNTIVQQSGENDRDGNQWRPQVVDEKRPPHVLATSLRHALFSRR